MKTALHVALLLLAAACQNAPAPETPGQPPGYRKPPPSNPPCINGYEVNDEERCETCTCVENQWVCTDTECAAADAAP